MIDIAALLGLRPDLFGRGRPLAGDLVRWQFRASSVIWVLWHEGEWHVVAGSYEWVHGSREAALEDARELSENLGLPIREVVS